MVKKFTAILDEERKESAKIADAFLAKKKAKAKRTHTDGSALYLHGNKIAWHGENGKVHATLAGYPTVTTRERLNALASRMGGKRFHQKKGKQHYGDQEVGHKDVIDLNEGTIEKMELGEAHTASQLYSKEKKHSERASAAKSDAKLERYLGRESYPVFGPGHFKSAEKYERKSKQHQKASDAARRLLASLKVSGKENTKELAELNSTTLRRYVSASVLDHSAAARDSGRAIQKGDEEGLKNAEKRVIKRNLGIGRAVDKLIGMSKVKANNLREEEQLDEGGYLVQGHHEKHGIKTFYYPSIKKAQDDLKKHGWKLQSVIPSNKGKK